MIQSIVRDLGHKTVYDVAQIHQETHDSTQIPVTPAVNSQSFSRQVNAWMSLASHPPSPSYEIGTSRANKPLIEIAPQNATYGQTMHGKTDDVQTEIHENITEKTASLNNTSSRPSSNSHVDSTNVTNKLSSVIADPRAGSNDAIASGCNMSALTEKKCLRRSSERHSPLQRAQTTHFNTCASVNRIVSTVESPFLPLAPSARSSATNKIQKRSLSVPAAGIARDSSQIRLAIVGLHRRAALNIQSHYYPEGGWGWCVLVSGCIAHALTLGYQLTAASLLPIAAGSSSWIQARHHHVLWGSVSLGISLAASLLSSALNRYRFGRLSAFLGGLLCGLGVLFTSFSQNDLQVLFSHGLVYGIGASFSRDSASAVLVTYYRKRRHLVEALITLSAGLGLSTFSFVVVIATSSLGWRRGLQVLALIMSTIALCPLFYRPASLYHPQRRAIQHLKVTSKKLNLPRKKKRVSGLSTSFWRGKNAKLLLTAKLFSTPAMYVPILTKILYLDEDTVKHDGERISWELALIGAGWLMTMFLIVLLQLAKSDSSILTTRIIFFISCLAGSMCVPATLYPDLLSPLRRDCVHVMYGSVLSSFSYSARMLTCQHVASADVFVMVLCETQAAQALPLIIAVATVSGYFGERPENWVISIVTATSLLLAAILSVFCKDNKQNGASNRNYKCNQEIHHDFNEDADGKTPEKMEPRNRQPLSCIIEEMANELGVI